MGISQIGLLNYCFLPSIFIMDYRECAEVLKHLRLNQKKNIMIPSGFHRFDPVCKNDNELIKRDCSTTTCHDEKG